MKWELEVSSEIAKKIGDFFLKERKKENMKLQDIAEETKVEKKRIIKLEEGNDLKLDIGDMQKLANYYQINLKEILETLGIPKEKRTIKQKVYTMNSEDSTIDMKNFKEEEFDVLDFIDIANLKF